MAADISAAARTTCFLTYTPNRDETGGRFERRTFPFPARSIPNGLGGLSTIYDGLGLMLTMFPDEVAERITALALEGHDESKAIGLAERYAALDAINAEILLIEREHEFWVRKAREESINPGPRISNDIRAILDIH